MKRFAFLLLALAGCGSPYEIRISDDRAASNGPLFFFGWADPPLIPGTRLADAPAGSRVVLWNPDLEMEAIVDIGETCSVLVRRLDGARAPTDQELQAIASVFPSWPVVASPRVSDYAGERRLERRFWSHIQAHMDRLEGTAAVEFALGVRPVGWLELGGRVRAMIHAVQNADAADLGRLVDGTLRLGLAERKSVFWWIVEREQVDPAVLLKIVRAGGPEIAVTHEDADEAVCLAAVEEIAKWPLSSDRRSGLEDVLESNGRTARVRDRLLEVPLAYPEDRDALRARAGVK